MTVLEQDSASFLQLLERTRARYVLLGSVHAAEPNRLAPLLRADCRAFSLVASFPPRTYLLELRSEAQQSQDDAACQAMTDYRRANVSQDFNWGPWPP